MHPVDFLINAWNLVELLDITCRGGWNKEIVVFDTSLSFVDGKFEDKRQMELSYT